MLSRLPLADNACKRNVDRDATDPTSMLTLTRRLLHLRRTHAALAVGTYEPLAVLPAGCLGFARRTEEQALLVLLNLTAESMRVRLPAIGPTLISTLNDGGPAHREGSVELRPEEGVVASAASTT